MGLCLRGRNEPPELTVDDLVNLKQWADKQPIVQVGYEYMDLHPLVQQVSDSIFNNQNQSMNVGDNDGDLGCLLISPAALDSIQNIDLFKVMNFLHEKFPELKDYLEDTKEKEDEESIDSEMDGNGAY